MNRVLCVMAFILGPLSAWGQDAPLDAMQDYADFATYDAGIIRPDQITEDIFPSLAFIDTRQVADFENETIAGAINIEWREIFGRADELPADKKIVLFCNTGVLSAQAAFGLRVAGYENVLVLQKGFEGWQADRAFDPANP